MDERFHRIAALAASQHGTISAQQLRRLGVDASLRSKWLHRGVLQQVGLRAYATAGSPPSFERGLCVGLHDLDGHGIIAGRSSAQLLRLDSFTQSPLEYLVPWDHRSYRTGGRVCSTTRPINRGDIVILDGLRCLSAEATIATSPLFDFTVAETENAIDSAIRLKLVAEQRLRSRVLREHSRGVNGGRRLLDALIDSGGESRLERWFLRLVREAGMTRPVLQKTCRDGSRILARVGAYFPGGLVVELEGHGTHATRQQRRTDAQRRTELTLRGYRVLTFTYEDVRDRPQWVVRQLRQALTAAA
jgi:hypothetical protein